MHQHLRLCSLVTSFDLQAVLEFRHHGRTRNLPVLQKYAHDALTERSTSDLLRLPTGFNPGARQETTWEKTPEQVLAG